MLKVRCALNYSMEQRPSWYTNQFWASQQIPRILWNLKFLTAVARARHLSLSWASWNQSIPPHQTFPRSNLILPSHLRLGLSSGVFPSGFPINTLYKPPHPIRSTGRAHLVLLDFITLTIFVEQHRSLSSSLCSYLHFPVTSSPLDLNNILNVLFLHTLDLRYSLNVSDQVLHL